jgi:D-glycero-D-manno-heptose 1,7-bisphosphate phosphatase
VRRRPLLDALFLDRDGTLIAERGFLADPKGIRLAPGAPALLARLVAEGTLLFVVTNQSGVARGLTRWDEVNAVNAEVERRLAARGVPIAGWLVCPHHPEGKVKEYAVACRCRKPGTLLHRRALRRHSLSAARSAVVGDKWDDVGAGLTLGALAVHLLSGHGREQRAEVRAKGGGRVILAGGLADGLRKLRVAAEERER